MMDKPRNDEQAVLADAAAALDDTSAEGRPEPAATSQAPAATPATAPTPVVAEAVSKAPERSALMAAAAALDAPDARPGHAGPVAAQKPAATKLPPEELDRLSAEIVTALKTVSDPEIPADIYELGLIYRVDIDDDRNVAIDMTLTAPGCPVAGEMPGWVENAVNTVPGVASTTVKITFDPPWEPSRMSDEARLAVGMF